MSFISSTNGKEFLAGHFLLDDEECLRLTKTIPANHAQVVTNADGTKYVPAGTVYPTNDASAIGIVYEDTDVTSGDMPGSVVTKGVVYEGLLPEAVDTYSSATVPTGGNPKALGLYERSGTSPNYVYTLTTDTTAAQGKTYYSYDGKKIASAAKTAMAGITFIDSVPAITRPY